MGDEHLDTIHEKESDEFIKSSVENLVPNPSESEDLYNIGRIDSDYSDSEGDNLFPERFLHDDHISLPKILDSSNVVRIFPPLFTYPVTSSILLSPGSEDIIFDPDISNYHFSSFMPGVSLRSGTSMKFNIYPNHLNETPMEILSSTSSTIDQ
uniref:NAC domain-containing protein n=1 Tax=Tanacetum cinerariifolium TaxID=118510 RepID=A0A699LAP7_TANCI|nr:hypothetical protein [Tanacetum cinerariifolium]